MSFSKLWILRYNGRGIRSKCCPFSVTRSIDWVLMGFHQSGVDWTPSSPVERYRPSQTDHQAWLSQKQCKRSVITHINFEMPVH